MTRSLGKHKIIVTNIANYLEHLWLSEYCKGGLESWPLLTQHRSKSVQAIMTSNLESGLRTKTFVLHGSWSDIRQLKKNWRKIISQQKVCHFGSIRDIQTLGRASGV